MMKAIRLKRAGSSENLVLTEIPTPVPQPTEILVRIHAASVTRGDVVMRKIPRLLMRVVGERPRSVPGYEFAGKVEAIGEAVSGFEVGDRVFGTTDGLAQGSYAEYLCVPEDGIVTHIPANVEYEEAAPIPVGAMTALHFLRGAGTQPGMRVLVNGASGSVGSFAVQIAKRMGAHVTGVASTPNTELVVSLGADAVIDYTVCDFTEGDDAYDVVFDVAGRSSAKAVRGVLAEHGTFVTTRTRRRESVEELRAVREMVADGSVRAVVERAFELDQVAEAHRYVETGHKRGNVIVVVAGPE